MAVEVIYETHSLTTDNEAGIVTGWLPGELSTEGRRLALSAANRLGRRTASTADSLIRSTIVHVLSVHGPDLHRFDRTTARRTT